MQYSRPLLTFAFVKDSLEQTGDFAQGLMPLFAPIIKKNANKDFDSKKFVKDVEEYYGIRMHPYVADDWRDRLTNAGYLRAVERDGLIQRYINLNPDLPTDHLREDKYNQLLDEFADFVDNEFRKRGLEVERARIENAIFERLKTMEFISIINKPDKSSIPSQTLTLENKKEQHEEDAEVEPFETKFDVLCATFALTLHHTDPDKFALLSQIAGGALISEVVLGLRVPPTPGQSAKGLKVFIDAPLALDALNVADQEEYACANYIFEDLKTMGVDLCIFQRSVEEIQRIIHAILKAKRNGEYIRGTIGTRLLTDSLAYARLVDLSKSLNEKLTELSVNIVHFDEEHADLYKYFKVSQERDLVSHIRIFRELAARETDARTLANVMRYVMNGPKRSNVFASIAIFLTKNAGLVRAGIKYFSNEHMLSDEQAPPFITDRYMAGLLFIALGGKGKDITTRKLIANCAAAVTPREDVVTRMLSVLEQIDEAVAPEFEALMTEKRCSHYLMQSSLGDSDIITKDNALEIVEGIRRATAEKVGREKDLETAKALKEQTVFHQEAIKKAQAKIKHLDENLSKTKTQLDSLNQETRGLSENLAVAEKKTIDQERQLLKPCIEAGSRAGYFKAGTIYFLIAVTIGIIGTMADPFINLITSSFWRYVAWFLSVVAVTFILGLTQFWIFPDLIFGNRIRNAQRAAFRRRAVQLGLVDLSEKYEVNWKSKTLSPKGE